jgi:uncharacterized protein (DUF1015 family)
VLYDPARAGPLERLLAPPYDVVSPAQREALAALSPHGIVHVDLPAGDGDERYARAAERYRGWLAAGVLRRDAQPAIYRYQQTFEAEGRSWTRTGFICGVRLRRFEERVVLPHERTMSAPKADRLKLARACRAHFSQIFGLVSDPAGETEAAFEALAKRPPEAEATTGDGVAHRLWRLTDAGAQRRLAGSLAQRKVYIADGHHRYETMLALRDELRAEGGPRSTVEFGSFYLCRMEDPGLLVLATHRVLHGLASFELKSFLRAAGAYFIVSQAAPADVRAELARRGKAAPAIGLAHGDQLHFLSLRPDADLSRMPGPPVLHRLDVTLLHSLLLETILGVDRAAQSKQTNLRYVKDLGDALREARAPGVQAAFLLNPTRLEDLRAAADAGEVLPQKSTYFFPKLASGLVIDPLDPREEVPG